MNLFYQPGLINGNSFLDEDESRHALKVLRLKEGDQLRVTDGAGSFYDCRITSTTKGVCHLEVITTTITPTKSFRIHLAVGMLKNADRMEWLTEKATELGVDLIDFMTTTRSERKKANQERLEKIAVSAMKQSLKSTLPQVDTTRTFTNLVGALSESEKYIAHLTEGVGHLKNIAPKDKSYVVMIGPEGDFTDDEIQLALNNGFKMVGLGAHRLRTETAALAACHILNLVNE